MTDACFTFRNLSAGRQQLIRLDIKEMEYLQKWVEIQLRIKYLVD